MYVSINYIDIYIIYMNIYIYTIIYVYMYQLSTNLLVKQAHIRKHTDVYI